MSAAHRLSLPVAVEELESEIPLGDGSEVSVRLVKRVAGECDLSAVRPQILSDAEIEQLNRDADRDTQGRYSVGLLAYYRRIPSTMLRGYAASGALPFLEIADPENYAPPTRLQRAEQGECDKWDEGMFLCVPADSDATIDVDGEIAAMLRSTPKMLSHPATFEQPKCDDRLPDDARAKAFLLEIVFAFAYEARASYDDPTPESAWTICKLCRSLVCSTEAQVTADVDVLRVLRASYRRALTFPLYRSWALCERIRHDVADCLTGPHPKAFLYKLLADIDAIFALAPSSSGVPEVVEAVLGALWELWLAPLHAWIGRTDDDTLRALGEAVRAYHSSVALKEHVGTPGDWDIYGLEAAAADAVESGEGGYV